MAVARRLLKSRGACLRDRINVFENRHSPALSQEEFYRKAAGVSMSVGGISPRDNPRDFRPCRGGGYQDLERRLLSRRRFLRLMYFAQARGPQ